MMLKREAPKSKSTGLLRWLRAAGASAVAMATVTTAVVGCLDRPVAKQKPQTNNLFVAEIRQTAVDKIDLLFMIDNSISMADKQAILAEAVPQLMRRLVNPLCVDADGRPSAMPTYAQDNGSCASPTLSPEFSPIKDIHIGVVSSSLGSHGGVQLCALPTDNDNGQLLGVYRNPNNIPTFNNQGFLAWDPGRKYPGGETNAQTLQTNFTQMVKDVGQRGCGYEASLEAWYRFLADPEPPLPNGVTNDGAYTQVMSSSDPAVNPILQQRRQFLRDDSLVAIVMLTDENDCSIRDDGQGWLVSTTQIGSNQFRMFKGTAACGANPNDKCCFSCGVAPADTPQGCPTSADPASGCAPTPQYTPQEDTANLRCFDQKKRFGIDLLYPTSRYVDGLYSSTLPNRKGEQVVNPLFAGNPPREKSLVFFAGIIGVPWQDISTEASWADGAPLDYLKYTELLSNGGQNRWDWILGSPGNETTPPSFPLDPLMIETTADRSAAPYNRPHPANRAAWDPKPPTSPATANTINGHESIIADNSDLQYACTFRLNQPTNCTDEVKAMGGACDCFATDAKYSRSLCDGTTQRSAKAYPGVRHLQVLKDFGERGTHNSIVASICPKVTDNPSNPSYGYNPAVAAIVDRLKEALRGKCLPRKLTPDETGKVPCHVIEAAYTTPEKGCNCDAGTGRSLASGDISAAVKKQLKDSQYCDSQGTPACSNYCLCAIQQLPETDGDNARCKTSTTAPTDVYGYCYIDPELDAVTPGQITAKTTAETLVQGCPSTQRRLLRFAGDNVPAKGAIALIACLGATNDEQY